MCQGCFNEHWEGRDPKAYYQRADQDLKDQILKTLNLIIEHSGAIRSRVTGDIIMISGPLHVGVDDENYDHLAFWPKPGDAMAKDKQWKKWSKDQSVKDACSAWDALSPDARSIVCDMLHRPQQLESKDR